MTDLPAQTGARTLVVLAAAALVVAALKAAGTLLLPFLVAVFLSVLVAPMVLWLERRNVPVVLAALVVMLAVFAGVGAFAALVTQSMNGFEDAVPRYERALLAMSDKTIVWLQSRGLSVVRGDGWLEHFDPGSVVALVGVFLSGLVTALSNLALVLLTVFFVLLEVAGFPRKLRAAVGDPEADLRPFAEIALELQRYLWMKSVLSLLTGVLVWAWLAAIGVDFPVLWGLVAFLLNYVPNVGAIIAGLPPLLVAMVQPELGTVEILLVLAGFTAIHTVIGNILEPQMFGRELGLSPLVVFLSLAFWGWVWGPVGMLLSVPLTMVVKLLLERTEDLRWIAVLLGPSPGPHAPHRAHHVVANLLRRRRKAPGAGPQGLHTAGKRKPWLSGAESPAEPPVGREPAPSSETAE
ncbi:MAG TPA: AI-2E family transporter [Nannocystaceae bacterium]|nr:AI-2E family transporter [Nannocystaceae bacterium]